MIVPPARAAARLLLVASVGAAACRQAPSLPEPASYELHPALEIRVYAAEPDVVDPVALSFDAAERMYVVEMRDYPQGMPPDGRAGGTVRLLEDLDRDGRADRSTVFAEDLSFPTSVTAWKGGVFVTAPPQIVYLADTDGDRRADVRKVVYDGFTLGVTDSNVNGLRWALDNHVHGSNGGNDGAVRAPAQGRMREGAETAVGQEIDLRGLDFRFDPRTGEFETTFHTSGGFGLVFDAWGRSFSTYNIDHLQQRIVAVRYLARAPALPPLRATANVSAHGPMARIFPISQPASRPNHPEQAGYYSAAGGMGWLDLPGDDLPRGVLVCDVVGNLVSREALRWEGPVAVTERAPEERAREFFASRDAAFRPVGAEMGPDGALYLIDMQRDTIEHPDYIPQAVRATLDLRAGSDRGRIYRIVPRRGLPPREAPLEGATPEVLVAALASPSRWRRETAQRLLVERGEPGPAALAALRALAAGGGAAAGGERRRSPAPPSPAGARSETRASAASEGRRALARLHALWTLSGLSRIDDGLILAALDDPHQGVRENALRIAETRLSASAAIAERVVAMAEDPSARVRFQAALSMGEVDHPGRTAALVAILRRDGMHRFTRIAVASALRDGALDALLDVLRWSAPEVGSAASPAVDSAARSSIARELSDVVAAGLARDDQPALERMMRAASDPALEQTLRAAVLEGFETGLARAAQPPAATPATARLLDRLMIDGREHATVRAAWRIRRAIGLADGPAQAERLRAAAASAADPRRTVEDRLAALDVLALGSWPDAREPLLALLAPGMASQLQARAVGALAAFDDAALGTLLVARFRGLGPAARQEALRLLLRRPAYHGALLEALEEGGLTAGELDLDLEQRRRLLRSPAPGAAARAARLLRDEEYGNRAAVVDAWLARLPARGSPERGRLVYERLCAQCHVAGDRGHAVGPDLASLRHRSVEDLVTNVLDPHRAIPPDYVAYEVTLDSGGIEVGLIAEESAAAITLLQAGGSRRTIPRARIAALRSTGWSLMPSGLEQGLEPQELRDVVAFVQGNR